MASSQPGPFTLCDIYTDVICQQPCCTMGSYQKSVTDGSYMPSERREKRREGGDRQKKTGGFRERERKERRCSLRKCNCDPSLSERNNEPFILGRMLTQNLISGISNIM